VKEIEGYELILAEQWRVLKIIVTDCEEMKARYTAKRMTSINEAEGDIDIASLIPVEDVALTISHTGYVKRVPLDTYRTQGAAARASVPATPRTTTLSSTCSSRARMTICCASPTRAVSSRSRSLKCPR
jgi:DNA gyrase/topoisomerase IV subunit A